MKQKIKPLILYIRNGRGQLLKARNVKALEGKLPSDEDILARYVVCKQQGYSKYKPFLIHLDHDESIALIKEIEMKKDGCYPVEVLDRGYGILIDNAIICAIDINVDLSKL